MYPDMLQGQAVSFLDHYGTIRYAIAEQFFQSLGHGRTGFPGSNHQNTIVRFELETVLSNLQGAVRRLDISKNRLNRIYGLEG